MNVQVAEHTGRRRAAITTLAACLALGLGASSCARKVGPYPLKDPMWTDPDTVPFSGEPKEYWSPFGWDTANQTLFRPISRFLAVDPGAEAVNVNALDEVPDSSWFTNRIGLHPMTPEELAKGSCTGAPMETEGPWTVVGAKPNGANPGFIIKAADGRRYLLKFDGLTQGERPTGADVIGSVLYHAAGFYTPCNEVAFFDPAILTIGEGAKSESSAGKKIPLTMADIDKVLAKGSHYADGRYRAAASLFLDGKPIGPWKYEDTRRDDPNDVVPHEDRRELRGAMVLHAWLNHFDCREQNTLATWIDPDGDGVGHIRHNYIDFGDTLGSFWETPGISERHGHSNYFDFSLVPADLITFGLIKRPWDKVEYGPSGPVFGYFGIERFKPARWRPGYPNPAYTRMTERDAAWGARILARLSDAHIEAAVARARFTSEEIRTELVRLLVGRRDKALRRWLGRLSPLSVPEVATAADGGAEICFTDLSVHSGIAPAHTRTYDSRAWLGLPASPTGSPPVRAEGDRVCVALPAVAGASSTAPGYLVVDVISSTPSETTPGPMRVHLYHLGGSEFRIVGVDRPKKEKPPRL